VGVVVWNSMELMGNGKVLVLGLIGIEHDSHQKREKECGGQIWSNGM